MHVNHKPIEAVTTETQREDLRKLAGYLINELQPAWMQDDTIMLPGMPRK